MLGHITRFYSINFFSTSLDSKKRENSCSSTNIKYNLQIRITTTMIHILLRFFLLL